MYPLSTPWHHMQRSPLTGEPSWMVDQDAAIRALIPAQMPEAERMAAEEIAKGGSPSFYGRDWIVGMARVLANAAYQRRGRDRELLERAGLPANDIDQILEAAE